MYFKFMSACVAGILPCLLVTTGAIADEQFKPKLIISLPDGQSLLSFDISWVDPTSHSYALAEKTNVSIDIVDTRKNVVTKQLRPTPGFVGVNSPVNGFTVASAGGPNGVFITEHRDVWAGDGPVFSTCTAANTCTVATPSTVKVIDLDTGATKAVISTGGQRRTDEGCYNPRSDVVLFANDQTIDNFITFISEDSYKVLQKIHFDGTDPNGNNIIANGIEQCQFNPRNGKFYLNIPRTLKDGSGPGMVLVISEHAPFHVEKAFTIPIVSGCVGPAGMAIGPNHQIGLGCGGTNSLIIDDRTGIFITTVLGEGGTDEAWYNPGNNHYFFARSGAGKLGVEDAGPPPSADPDATTGSATPATSGNHSVAADPFRNQTYVPIRGNSAPVTPPTLPSTNTICSTNKDVSGHPGNDAKGCIAVYTARGDKDDRVAHRDEDEH